MAEMAFCALIVGEGACIGMFCQFIWEIGRDNFLSYEHTHELSKRLVMIRAHLGGVMDKIGG